MDQSPSALRLIARTVAPMHRETDALSEQVSQALLGQEAAVLESRGGWARIRTPDNYEGWVEAAAVVPPPPGWQAPWVEVDELWANFRAGDSYRLAAAGVATLGVRLPLVQNSRPRIEALFPDGRKLWTEARRVKTAGGGPVRPASLAALCRTARRLLGVPYLWGGSSPFGLDCSAFVQLVMGLHGIPLLRDARLQAAQGAPSPAPDTGDLVFFGPTQRPEAITHVGMMLDTQRFIHAAGSDRVRINRLTDEPYAAEFRFARRVIGEAGGE